MILNNIDDIQLKETLEKFVSKFEKDSIDFIFLFGSYYMSKIKKDSIYKFNKNSDIDIIILKNKDNKNVREKIRGKKKIDGYKIDYIILSNSNLAYNITTEFTKRDKFYSYVLANSICIYNKDNSDKLSNVINKAKLNLTNYIKKPFFEIKYLLNLKSLLNDLEDVRSINDYVVDCKLIINTFIQLVIEILLYKYEIYTSNKKIILTFIKKENEEFHTILSTLLNSPDIKKQVELCKSLYEKIKLLFNITSDLENLEIHSTSFLPHVKKDIKLDI